MSQPLQCSPHLLSQASVTKTMALVLLACVPAYGVSTWFFGWGLTINAILCIVTATAVEGLVMKLRRRNPWAFIRDSSALVTAILLAFTIPSGAPWWIPVLGATFAILIGKQVYGGLGLNLFNPAMVGYVALLVAFPLQMTAWQIPGVESANGDYANPLGLQGLLVSLQLSFPFLGIAEPSGLYAGIDGFAKATPLLFHKLAGHSVLIGQWQTEGPVFDRSTEIGWEWINIAFLFGGVFLLFKRVISWHIPLSLIATVIALAFIFYQPGKEAVYGSPYLHLFGTATMIGAFFIATDPVSAPSSPLGKIIYGAIAGVLIYCIRIWGSYLDSVGFAILLVNGMTPLLDYCLRPRIFGEQKRSLWPLNRRTKAKAD